MLDARGGAGNVTSCGNTKSNFHGWIDQELGLVFFEQGEASSDLMVWQGSVAATLGKIAKLGQDIEGLRLVTN